MHRIYKNIQSNDQLFRLDIPDFLGVLCFYAICTRIMTNYLYTLLGTVAVYYIVLYLKKDKPTGWTLKFIKFQKSPQFIIPKKFNALKVLKRGQSVKWRCHVSQ